VTVLRLSMVSSSSTWLHRCGGGIRRCQQRRLRWVVRPATRPMLRARCATSAAVRPLSYCAIAATGRGYHTRCLVPALPGVPDGDWVCPGCARSCTAPAGYLPACRFPPRPRGAAYDDVACQVCAGQHGAASVLLCDGCDRGFHLRQCMRRACACMLCWLRTDAALKGPPAGQSPFTIVTALAAAGRRSPL
jgi:hypothetical protein